MGTSGSREPDYPGTIRYVLRRRDRFGFWTAIFLFAFSAALLTVATVSVATGYTSVAGVWDFLVFGLLMAAGGIFGLRDRAAIVGQVLMAVVPSGEDFQPGAGARRLSSPDQCGVTVDLHDEKVRLGELSDAVHTYAPGLPVWDAGNIKSKNVRVEGR